MRVIFDIDGVSADFSGYYLELARKIAGAPQDDLRFSKENQVTYEFRDYLPLSPDQFDLIEEDLLLRPGVAQRLPVLPGAVEGITRIAAIAEVGFLSTLGGLGTRSQTWCYDRLRWVEAVFGKELREKVILGKPKEWVPADIFVDDKASNMRRWLAQNSGLGVLWKQAYNAKDVPQRALRMDSWSLLYEIVSEQIKSDQRWSLTA